MIRFACPGCSAMFTVEDTQAGKAGQCPKCQSQFIIPAAPPPAGGMEYPLTEDPHLVESEGPPLSPPPPVDPPALSPPPAPPPAGPNDPVEIRPCPKCRTRLSVLPADLGLDIECPSCKAIYQANRADAPPPPSSGGGKSGRRANSGRGGRGDDRDRDDDRRDRRRSRRDDEDDRDDRWQKRHDDDEGDDDYGPRRRRSRRYDDDDYGRRLAPHRGGLVLTFGIVGLVFCWTVVGLVFSVLAWVFGAQDLRAMDDRRMDDSGRSSTNTGKILGIVSLVLFGGLIVLRCGSAFLRAGLR